MPAENTTNCRACGIEVSSKVPEYYVELECFRKINKSEEQPPRRGSDEYHAAIEKLAPEVREEYFNNLQMYDDGHLWCPACGIKLGGSE
jgi:hypothetical protein